jgi:hypothetical protein
VQPVVAEHMGREPQRRKYLRKRRIADAEAPGVGAERRHHHALAVRGEAAPLHRAAARRHPGLGMQMTGDLAVGSGRLVTEHNWSDCDFARHHAAEIARQRRIVIARDPDPVAPRLQRRNRVAIGRREPIMRVAAGKALCMPVARNEGRKRGETIVSRAATGYLTVSRCVEQGSEAIPKG